MTDLIYSLLLLLGMAALVVADDRKLRRQLRYLATRWVSR
jgi:hypothetical protein